MAGAVLGVVKEQLICFPREHLIYFPGTAANVLFSATQLLNQLKAYFKNEMRQELLEWAKVSVSVQALQAYHSEGRPTNFITLGRNVFWYASSLEQTGFKA